MKRKPNQFPLAEILETAIVCQSVKIAGRDVWSRAMARKRKLFTGVAPIGGHKVKSLREARRITSKFHQLNNEIGLIDSNSSVPEEKLKKQRIEEEIEMLGGRNRYQQASVVTTTHHKVSYSFMNRCKLIIYIFFRPANG
jgi:hypothetical protein